MQISIYEKITGIKTREDKKFMAKYASKPYSPSVVTCNDIGDLIRNITKYGWSPSTFSGFRLKNNFKSTDFLVLDIDDGLTISESLKRVESNLQVYTICLPTYSHTKELNKFRLIFPLSITIKNRKQYQSTMQKILEVFPESDPSCITDESRMYYPCSLSDDGYVYDGELIEPCSILEEDNRVKQLKSELNIFVGDDIKETVSSIYGEDRTKIPECVDYFIKNAHTGMKGEWNISLNKFCFTLSLQGCSIDTIESVVEQLAPYDFRF